MTPRTLISLTFAGLIVAVIVVASWLAWSLGAADTRTQVVRETTLLYDVGGALAIIAVLGATWALLDRRLATPLRMLTRDIETATYANPEHQIAPAEADNLAELTTAVAAMMRELAAARHRESDAVAELRAANDRLKELDRLKDEFLSTVTHELRTPLISLRSFSEILYDTPDLKIEERQKFLAIIIRESERLTRSINQVLDLTKIEAGRMDWQMGEVDLKTVIDDAVATLDHRFRDRSITLRKDLPGHVPAVMGDRDQLMQVVINLLSNAEKFCRPKSGKVVVSLKAAPDNIVVSIGDNGPGIAARDQALIFENFHQVSDGASGYPAGSGLGLAISRKIVEHFGGRIWVASDVDKGAVFSFSIPIRAAAPRAVGRA